MGTVKLTVLSDKLRGNSYVLEEEQYTIGRGDSADITIAESTISGLHCTLTKLSDGLYSVKDENSTNGTRVNGEKLEEDPVPLKNGDLLQVGNIEMLYENADEHHTEVRTMTVINLDETGTMDIATVGMKSMSMKNSPKRSMSLRDNKKHKVIMNVIMIAMGIAVLVGIIGMITTIMK